MSARVSAQDFRATMSRLVSGVTIVGVSDGKRQCGMTASSVTSLSLEPPMLLVCIDHAAAIHDLITRSELFSVSVLADTQADLARRFADPERHDFPAGHATSPGGLPLVAGALAHIECARAGVYAGGDHSIVTGTIGWSHLGDGEPLTYFRARYGRLAP